MATFRKIAKSNQKNHQERSQPTAREHLGILPKKKDYRQRADEHHRKQNTLKVLRRKALERNPDEFYFNMVHTRLEDGVHQCKDDAPVYTPEQLKLMQSQDIQYVNFKRSLELKKIEKLKATLHLLDAPGAPKNKHIVFLDTKKEVEEFDAAEYLQTDGALVDRVYNRPRLETLRAEGVKGKLSDSAMAEAAAEKARLYSLLQKRIEREKQLHIVAEKMEVKKQLLDKTAQKKRVREETVNSAAVYKWAAKRKR